MVVLSFLRFVERLSVLLSAGAPVVNTSPALTAPLGLLGAGAVPLGTALGLAVVVPGAPGAVGVVWAEASVTLPRLAASSKRESFIGNVGIISGAFTFKVARGLSVVCKGGFSYPKKVCPLGLPLPKFLADSALATRRPVWHLLPVLPPKQPVLNLKKPS
jgi:hypothetical protein